MHGGLVDGVDGQERCLAWRTRVFQRRKAEICILAQDFCFFSWSLLWWQAQVALFEKENLYAESRIHDYGSGWSHPAGW